VQTEIELRWMRFVVAVAEERNFTRAAMRCHISQPALSRRVSEVESVLGTKLFERKTRSVSVTKAGHLFVREARHTLEQSRRTVSLLQAFAKSNEKQALVGVSALADPARLHTLIEQSARTVSGLSLSVRTASTLELMQELLRGNLDLAILDLPAQAKGVRTAPLFSEPLVAAVPEKLFSPKKTQIEWAEFLKLSLTLLTEAVDPARPVIEQHLASVGSRAFRIHDAGGIPELLDQVAIHHRVGLIRQSASRFQRQGVIYKPLSEPMTVGCALAWRCDYHGPAMASFRDALLASSRRP
jgi:DNA-binding transcriptional LysR family regulator